MPDIDGIEFGLLATAAKASKLFPTPQAGDSERGSMTMKRGNPTLLGAVKLWPTPMNYSHVQDSNPPGITKLDCAVRPELNKHLWPTPTKQDDRGTNSKQRDLQHAVRLFPTPQAHDVRAQGTARTVTENGRLKGNGNSASMNLATMAKLNLLPTPRANERSQHNSQDNGVALSQAVKSGEARGQLNPEFVEWLMGYLIGWTDCEDSATPSYHKSPPD